MTTDPITLASQIDGELRALPVPSAEHCRTVRRKYSRLLRKQPGDLVLDVGPTLVHAHGHRWFGCELVRFHREAFARVGEADLEEFGRGINS